MIGAYIALVVGVMVWALAVPTGKQLPEGAMRGVTIFGGAFLLGVCFLELMPEAAGMHSFYAGTKDEMALLPFAAVLAGFLLQQLLDGLSAHAEHGHTEEGFTFGGLMLGLCLHAFLEGMPLVEGGEVNRGLLWGIVIHNIPVSLILVGLMSAKGYRLGRVSLLLLLFGLMSPLGSLCCQFLLRPDADMQCLITGLVVGVLLHVSSSILFDHKPGRFSWLSIGLMLAAFLLSALII